MSDRHLRRAGSDYRDAFLELLPQGEAWPKHSQESVLWQSCDGLNDFWGFVDGRAADLLERESDPRITVELLPDWERNWGLPDPCYTAPQTVAQRQTALIARMTLWGSQSRQWYIDFAAFLGYTITITEYRPWMVGLDRCGDARVYGDGTTMRDAWGRPILNPLGLPVALGELSEWPSYGLGPPENRYYWTGFAALPVNAVSIRICASVCRRICSASSRAGSPRIRRSSSISPGCRARRCLKPVIPRRVRAASRAAR
jgi:uncharacterized protein YmfQ (DUF2313 family)